MFSPCQPTWKTIHFDDPVVQQRFLAMLQAIAQDSSSKGIKYILQGNEVNLYLSAYHEELSAFLALLEAGIKQIHQEVPGVKVGTIVMSSLLNDPQLF
jgi:predicted ATP-grasp superfamily ATP-dependent carboligase